MSDQERFRAHVAVYIILIWDNEIFVMRRFQTGWMDGKYGLPAGHMEAGETVAGAAVREAKEEIGIDIDEKDLRVVHVMHRVNPEREYIDFYFVAKQWSGRPYNAEPEKCNDIRWVPLDELPENMVDSVREGIENYRKGVNFSEFGRDGRL